MPATFLLLHGAASSGWYWHLVEPLLVAAGHRCLTPDLPADDHDADLTAYLATAVDALDGLPASDELVVVAQSMAGVFTPVIAEARPVDRIVMLAAMIPDPRRAGTRLVDQHPPRRGPTPLVRRARPRPHRSGALGRPREVANVLLGTAS